MIEFVKDVIGALTKVPIAVAIWVNILFTVNLLEFPLMFLAPHSVVTATVIAAIFGIFPNMVMLWKWRGFSRLMGLPHIVPWLVLNGYILTYLFTDKFGARLTVSDGAFLYYWAWAIVICNTISILFDLNDTRRWFAGEREIVRGDETESRLAGY
jgi:hypothetical protein